MPPSLFSEVLVTFRFPDHPSPLHRKIVPLVIPYFPFRPCCFRVSSVLGLITPVTGRLTCDLFLSCTVSVETDYYFITPFDCPYVEVDVWGGSSLTCPCPPLSILISEEGSGSGETRCICRRTGIFEDCVSLRSSHEKIYRLGSTTPMECRVSLTDEKPNPTPHPSEWPTPKRWCVVGSNTVLSEYKGLPRSK